MKFTRGLKNFEKVLLLFSLFVFFQAENGTMSYIVNDLNFLPKDKCNLPGKFQTKKNGW